MVLGGVPRFKSIVLPMRTRGVIRAVFKKQNTKRKPTSLAFFFYRVF